ncbi:MAG: alpha/beta hydrolase [Drouetiella hepatica Uher 2000/2452]|jgi:pimeloyl-ACP methyl ester carboxylesterase|uniref:Alpha/beta hydrolase n=1 Tax=Drouetiella hepatica Uher 2000/2452 TaxID=904376 RepID=A0A951Q6D1_9CYAN|nr:alpha/beta hydrolase [Drouetiella hepatica Uher 2000/2452]
MVNTINILGFPHAYELSSPPSSSPVLVFLHGWLLSRAYWQPVIQRLSADYSCLSYDMRGFGESQISRVKEAAPEAIAPQPSLARRSRVSATEVAATEVAAETPVAVISTPSSYTLAAYAQDLAVLLKELKIAKAWLVGHSLGGSIALWTADQLPETIAGVICVNVGGGIYIKEEFEKFRVAGQQIINLRRQWLAYIPLLDVILSRMNVAQPVARRWGRQRLLDLLNAQSEAAIGTLLDSTTETEVHYLPQIVSRLHQPTYFIAGANDKIMEPQYVSHLASFHPSFACCGNNVVEIPNCGHLAMVEQSEAVVNEIRTILAKSS